MPIFACYRGDCNNLSYQQAGRSLFLAVDALGQEWLCVETTLAEIPTEFMPESAIEMMDAQGKAHKHGLSVEGTSVSLFDCPNEESLRRRLVLSTYPPFGESLGRLVQAGWSCREDFGTGQPHRLTVEKGRHTLSAEGETANEVWYRMVVKAVGVIPGMEGNRIMPLSIRTDPAPLRVDEHGVIRVGKSQVLLDIVIREHNNGANAEGIVRGYPTLDLADVYATIAYYLRHREEVDAYLQARRKEAEELRHMIEAKQPDRAQLREKLLARKEAMEQGHASPAK